MILLSQFLVLYRYLWPASREAEWGILGGTSGLVEENNDTVSKTHKK